MAAEVSAELGARGPEGRHGGAGRSGGGRVATGPRPGAARAEVPLPCSAGALRGTCGRLGRAPRPCPADSYAPLSAPACPPLPHRVGRGAVERLSCTRRQREGCLPITAPSGPGEPSQPRTARVSLPVLRLSSPARFSAELSATGVPCRCCRQRAPRRPGTFAGLGCPKGQRLRNRGPAFVRRANKRGGGLAGRYTHPRGKRFQHLYF